MAIEPGLLITGAKTVITSVKELLTAKSSYDKQHIELLKTKVQMLVDLAEAYEKENKELTEETIKLREQLSKYLVSEEYTESNGAAFKRNADGTYNSTPYCPRCHNSLSTLGMQIPYRCSNKECGHMANFNNRQLSSVLSQLPK